MCTVAASLYINIHLPKSYVKALLTVSEYIGSEMNKNGHPEKTRGINNK